MLRLESDFIFGVRIYGFGPELGFLGWVYVQISGYTGNSVCVSQVKVRIWSHIWCLNIWFRAQTWISRMG